MEDRFGKSLVMPVGADKDIGYFGLVTGFCCDGTGDASLSDGALAEACGLEGTIYPTDDVPPKMLPPLEALRLRLGLLVGFAGLALAK